MDVTEGNNPLPPAGSGGPVRLILASRSARRAQLLREAGFDFETAASDLDEASLHRPGEPTDQRTVRLAQAKARKVAHRYTKGLILGADTLIDLDGRPIGQPADRTEAETTLQLLLDRPHKVFSSIACLDAATGRCTAWTESAVVRIENPGAEALKVYLDSGAWAGKAGGYNLAELADAWTIEVQGDPDTVTGLPTGRLKQVIGGVD